MKLEEIHKLWETDSPMDKASLDTESMKIPSLHHKYLKLYDAENLRLKKLKLEFKKLELLKFEYYSGKMCQEDLQTNGWEQFTHRVLKQDLPRYMDADQDIINALLQIDYQSEKVDALKSILTHINNRNFTINNAIKWQQFLVGGN